MTPFRAGGPDGWLLSPGPPFDGELFLGNDGYSKMLIGPNGYGKTRFLTALGRVDSTRVFSRLPKRLQPYVVQAEQGKLDEALGGVSVATLSQPSTGDRARAIIEELDENPEYLWALTPRTGVGVVELLEHVDKRRTGQTWHVPEEAAQAVVEIWSSPDARATEGFDEGTRLAFEKWFATTASTLSESLSLTTNPLVARDLEGKSCSVLRVAEAYLRHAADRTSERLRAMVGFSISLQIKPEDGFRCFLRLAGDWFPFSAGSTAIKRWVMLAAAETFREIQMFVEAQAQFIASDFDVDEFVTGLLPPHATCPLPIAPFATRSSWIMLDEPEVHLFGSEAQRLGQSLASYSESGRMVIASHSLELASRLVGRCEFLNFTAPGIYELTRPSDWSTSQVEFLAGNGPAGLSGMRVLYVEGVWDQRMVEHLFGDDLRTYQILVSPMHGTVGASACVTSVWQRMIRAPFGVMFDALESSSSLADWASVCERAQTSVRADLVRELRRRAQASALPNEDRALLLLEANLALHKRGCRSGVRIVGVAVPG